MIWKDQLSEIKNTIIEQEEVFDAVRRGYSELGEASNSEILEHFSLSSPSELQGHVSNVKGILFEMEVQDKLDVAGVDSILHSATNHPLTDMQVIENGTVAEEIQLKATDSTSYISETISENPDIAVVTTTEVANEFGNSAVIDSGISDSLVEETVLETLSPIPASATGLAIRVGLAVLTGGLFF